MQSDDATKSTAFEVMPAAGGAAREVFRADGWTGNSRFGVLAWTPNQRHLLFVRPSKENLGERDLWKVSATGGEPEGVGLSMSGLISPQVRPDGSQISFASTKAAAMEVWALENFLPKRD